MKKLLVLTLSAALMVAMIGCGKNTNINEETYNGITKTTTVTTQGSKTSTEVTYKDEAGNVLSAEDGEAAFLAAKDAVENPQTEEENSEELEVYTASLTFVNETGVDIVEMYMPLGEDDNWGDDLIAEGDVFESGTTVSLDGTVKYDANTDFNIAFVTSNGERYEFDAFYLVCEDPENVIVAFTETDDSYVIETR